MLKIKQAEVRLEGMYGSSCSVVISELQLKRNLACYKLLSKEMLNTIWCCFVASHMLNMQTCTRNRQFLSRLPWYCLLWFKQSLKLSQSCTWKQTSQDLVLNWYPNSACCINETAHATNNMLSFKMHVMTMTTLISTDKKWQLEYMYSLVLWT